MKEFRKSHTQDKEEQKMDVTMTNTGRQLNLNKIANRITKVITTEEALKDVTPIQWSEEIISGKRKLNIVKKDTKE